MVSHLFGCLGTQSRALVRRKRALAIAAATYFAGDEDERAKFLPLVKRCGSAILELSASTRTMHALVTAAGAPNNRVASLKSYEDAVHLLTSSTETASHQVSGSRRPEREQSLRDTFGTFVLPWETAWLDSGLRGPRPWDTQYV